MTPEAQTITAFYDRFAHRDAQGMVALYAEDVVFHDPAFGELRGVRRAARRSREGDVAYVVPGKDLEVRTSGISGSSGTGRAHWEADYTFSTGRRVHNVVDAGFELRDGLITRHSDTFSFSAWARQAFGPLGMIGGVPGAAKTFQILSNRQLDTWMAKHP